MGVRGVFARLRKTSRRARASCTSTDATVTTERDDSMSSICIREKRYKPMPPTSFLRLCQQQRFDEMLQVLELEDEFDLDGWLFLEAQTMEQSNKFTWTWTGARKNHNLHLFRGESPLHIVVQYSPTEAVVDKLVEFLTRKSKVVPEDAVDITGKTPLHVAAASGCSSHVVARLVSGISAVMPAVAKDVMGRHALHWACTNPNGRAFARKKELAGDADNSYRVIGLLIETYPEALCLMDIDGRTPMDLAILNGANERIVNLLEGDEYKKVEPVEKKMVKETPRISNKKNVPAFEIDVEEGEINFQEDATYFPDEIQKRRMRDDVSSVGLCGVSHVNEMIFRRKARRMADTPWKNMTNIEEVIKYVEQAVQTGQPLFQDPAEIFESQKNQPHSFIGAKNDNEGPFPPPKRRASIMLKAPLPIEDTIGRSQRVDPNPLFGGFDMKCLDSDSVFGGMETEIDFTGSPSEANVLEDVSLFQSFEH